MVSSIFGYLCMNDTKLKNGLRRKLSVRTHLAVVTISNKVSNLSISVIQICKVLAIIFFGEDVAAHE